MRAAMRDAVKKQKGNRAKAKDSKARWKEANQQKRKVRSLLALALVGPLALVCFLYPLHSMGYFRLWKPAALSRALSNPQQTESLDLAHVYLESVPEGIDSLKNLKTLILDQNEITELDESIFKCEKLETLSAQYNKIKAIPPDIGKTDKLRSLNLSGNAISEIPPEVFKLSLLENLKLSNNSLTSLPADIGKLKQLKVLDLRNNDISNLPDSLSKLTNLEELNLANNKLSGVPNLTGTPNLKSIVLTGTGLSKAEIDALRGRRSGGKVMITR